MVNKLGNSVPPETLLRSLDFVCLLVFPSNIALNTLLMESEITKFLH